MFTNEMTSWLPETPAWVPAECPVPIRGNHWFWHPDDRTPLRSLEELISLYERSVGHGATLLLNLAPDRRGLLPDEEVQRVIEFGEEIRRRYGSPVAETRGVCPVLTLSLPEGAGEVSSVILMENIREGERVRSYVLEAERDGSWIPVVSGSAIGHKKIDRFPPVRTSRFRLRVTQSEGGEALIRSFAAFANG
jgi:alpha-L-fucosidase